MSNTLQLQHVITPEMERDRVLAQLRDKRLAALAERLWAALPKGGGR